MSPLNTTDSFTVGAVNAVLVAADAENQKKISNGSGGELFYKNASDVDTGDTGLAVGASVTTEENLWIISETQSKVYVQHVEGKTVQDLTTTDDVTVGDDAEVKGKLTVVETSTLKGNVTAEGTATVKKTATVEEGLTVKKTSTLEEGVEAKKTLKVVEGSTLEGAVTAKSTLAVTSTTTPTGGVVSSGGLPGVYAGNWAPATAESGTDTKLVEKKLFLTSVFLPANKKLKGVAILVGGTGSKGKVVAALFDATGKVLAKSSEATEGTALGAEKAIQKLAFTAEYDAVGPKTYFIGLTGNGVEEGTFRTIPADTASDNVWTGEKELEAKNTMADFAAPPSTFTGGKGPVAALY